MQVQLEDYYVTRLNVDFQFPSSEARISKTINLSFDYDTFYHRDEQLRRMLTLRVRGFQSDDGGERAGTTLDCEIHGRFVMPEGLEQDKLESLFRINGVSILYSTLRGIVGIF